MSHSIRQRHELNSLAGVHRYGFGVRIGMIDTGIAWRAHPHEFNLENITAPEDSLDATGHGTGIASLIAGRTLGIAPGAHLTSYRVMDPGGRIVAGRIAEAVQSCIDDDQDIIIIALASRTSSGELKRWCDVASEQGRIIVAAAGNTPGVVNYPAMFKSVLSVSAVDWDGVSLSEAGYTDCGTCVDVADVGSNVTVLDKKPLIVQRSGTSYATAVVGGKLALGASAYRRYGKRLTYQRLKEVLPEVSDRCQDVIRTGCGQINVGRLLASAMVE